MHDPTWPDVCSRCPTYRPFPVTYSLGDTGTRTHPGTRHRDKRSGKGGQATLHDRKLRGKHLILIGRYRTRTRQDIAPNAMGTADVCACALQCLCAVLGVHTLGE
eukprot:4771204-Prymnesium_polylepis.1